MAENNSGLPESWGDIPAEKRKALLEMAEGNIFWKRAAKKVGTFGKVAQVLLAIIALYAVFKDAAANLIQGIFNAAGSGKV